jgi:hypothetical protein
MESDKETVQHVEPIKYQIVLDKIVSHVNQTKL